MPIVASRREAANETKIHHREDRPFRRIVRDNYLPNLLVRSCDVADEEQKGCEVNLGMFPTLVESLMREVAVFRTFGEIARMMGRCCG